MLPSLCSISARYYHRQWSVLQVYNIIILDNIFHPNVVLIHNNISVQNPTAAIFNWNSGECGFLLNCGRFVHQTKTIKTNVLFHNIL